MARRRYQYGNPTLGGGESTSLDQARAYNTAAATQYSAGLKQDLAENEQEDATQSARMSLAHLLGYKSGEEIPHFGQLQAQFYSLPEHVQAGIYKAGGAPFLDGKSGMKLLAGNREDQEVGLEGMTRQIAKKFVSGEITQEFSSEGKSNFFQTVDDPSDPLGKRKMKRPLNAMQLKLLNRGFETGAIPNLDEPSTPLAPPQSPKMSTEDFQKVLNQRAARSSDTDAFQMVLNRRAAGTPAEVAEAVTPSSIAPVNFPNPPMDSALALRKKLGDTALGIANFAEENMSSSGQIPEFIGAMGEIPANIVNTLAGGENWMRRFIGGEGAKQYRTDILPTSATRMQQFSQNRAIPPTYPNLE